ncbi:hypothetical protein Pmani_002054 [Petrolisthes manimaculis]|uniref:Uncharacterized protein n=1 Tax=Petrolisthes manimaculis TaxID=1843537 RepID=A0AAE1URE4_9EUCA|nr:hypothetical protein Pmani_002054 [Petrolisthes manimaculis]
MAKTLSVLETIDIAEQLPQITTRATSALPNKIDEDWETLCSESVSCRSWWLSGKPRKLSKVTACSTPTLSVNSTDRNSEATWHHNHHLTEEARSHHLTVLSANVRGLRTNIGDLTHNFILRHRTDIAVVTETWLTSEMESTFEGKYSVWLRFTRNPTLRNKTLHREACRSMSATSMWAQRKWENDLRSKLCGPGVGSKTWWSLIKERQADLFSTKMAVADPNSPPPQLAQECNQEITIVEVTQERMEHLLRAVDVRKVSGPD